MKPWWESISEPTGRALGAVLAPAASVVASLRHARVFHPEGQVFSARFTADAESELNAAVATALAGPAMVRFSTALWRQEKEWPDALGVAVRFRRGEVPAVEPEADDQDVLFATIRAPWKTPFSPLTTYVHDFLGNDYYAVSPFQMNGRTERIKLRLVTPRAATSGETRGEKLVNAVQEGLAVLRLETQERHRGPWRRCGTLELVEVAALNQAALYFWPFRSGRGLKPVGLIHMMRKATYRASQRARSKGAESPSA